MPLTNSRSSIVDDWYEGSTKEIQSEPFLIKLEQGQQTKKKGGEKLKQLLLLFHSNGHIIPLSRDHLHTDRF